METKEYQFIGGATDICFTVLYFRGVGVIRWKHSEIDLPRYKG